MRIPVVPTLVAIIVAASSFALGHWQAGRAALKQAQFAQATAANLAQPVHLGSVSVIPEEIDHRRVMVAGEFVAADTIYLDNRQYAGQPGFLVLTPMRVEGGGPAVMINRGWMPVNPAGRELIAPPPVPAGRVEIEGHAALQVSSFMALRGAAAGKLGGIWPNFSFEAYVSESGLNLQPIVVQQTSATPDGLVRDWPVPGAGTERHIGYAIQWYLMSALSVGLWIWFVVLRKRPAHEPGRDPEDTGHAAHDA